MKQEAWLKKWLDSALLAHVLPMVIFLGCTQVAASLKVKNAALPWWQSAPEHWVYPLQIVVCTLVLWVFRRHYRFGPWRGFGLAAAAACVGIAFWILPHWLVNTRPEGVFEGGLWKWLGFVPREEGFDPTIFPVGGAAYWTTVVLRFVRMVCIVPFVEEILWRSFAMRALTPGDAEFQNKPFGVHDWRAYFGVTFLVMMVHHREDWAAAWIYGSLTYFVAVRTRSLAACVFMHAVANLLLGVYVMRTGSWGFW